MGDNEPNMGTSFDSVKRIPPFRTRITNVSDQNASFSSAGYGNTLNDKNDDDYISNTVNSDDSYNELEKRLWRNHYYRVAFHSLIPIYGLGILLCQFM